MMYNRINNIKSGTIGGVLGAWAFFGLIFLVESSLGFKSGTLYQVIALAVGSSVTHAVYVGFLLHMLVGTVIGILFGLFTSTRIFYVNTAARSISFGIITGLIAWVILFIPITFLLVNPALNNISMMINEPMLLRMVEGPLYIIGALAMHIIYGFILGLMYYLGIVKVPSISIEK